MGHQQFIDYSDIEHRTRLTWNNGDWSNFERGAHNDQQITFLLVKIDLSVKFLGKTFSEEDDVGLKDRKLDFRTTIWTPRNDLNTETRKKKKMCTPNLTSENNSIYFIEALP